MFLTLMRGPQHSSPQPCWLHSGWGCWCRRATDPTLLGSVLCGTSSPWQGMCLLLTLRSLPLSCTDCCYRKPCSQPGSASGGLPHTYCKVLCLLQPGVSWTVAQSLLSSGRGQTRSRLQHSHMQHSSSTLMLLKCLWESSVSPRRNFQNTHRISKHGLETAAQTAAPVGCPNRYAILQICLHQPKSVFSAGNVSLRNIHLTIPKEFKILQTSLTMLK